MRIVIQNADVQLAVLGLAAPSEDDGMGASEFLVIRDSVGLQDRVAHRLDRNADVVPPTGVEPVHVFAGAADHAPVQVRAFVRLGLLEVNQ